MEHDDSGADLAVGHQAPGQECPARKEFSGAGQEGKALFSKEERAAIIQLVMGVAGAASGRAVKLAVAALKFAAMLLLGAGVVAGYADGNELDEVGCTVAQHTDGAPHDARSAQAEKDATGKRPRSDGPGGRPPGGRPPGGVGSERGITGLRDYGITAPRDWRAAEARVVCKSLERCFLRLRAGGVGLCDERGEVCRVALAEGDREKAETVGKRVFRLFGELLAMGTKLKASPARVFDLMVFKKMTKAETAVACKCAASLITRRVALLENHFQMSIEKLRTFASDLKERQRTVKGDRYAKKKYGAVVDEPAQYDDDDEPSGKEDDEGCLSEEKRNDGW